MIVLSEVAQKLEAILNNLDDEVNVTEGLKNPLDYSFVVEAQGFHIDHILNKNTGNNFIPVFISSMGGQFNPVKGLKQGQYVIPITFYYPVRFRDDFFKLGDFLVSAFVGSQLTYGTLSGSAISNLSVPTYGEIQNFDLQEFVKWVENIYQRTIGVKTEPFMSMTIQLYLTNAAEGFMFGNSVTMSLLYTDENENEYTEENVVFDSGSIQSATQPNSEQEMEANIPEADGLPFSTAYSSGFNAYIKNNEFWFKVMRDWVNGKAQTMTFDVFFTFNDLVQNNQKVAYGKTCYIESINLPIQKGQLLTATFSFGKRSQN